MPCMEGYFLKNHIPAGRVETAFLVLLNFHKFIVLYKGRYHCGYNIDRNLCAL